MPTSKCTPEQMVHILRQEHGRDCRSAKCWPVSQAPTRYSRRKLPPLGYHAW